MVGVDFHIEKIQKRRHEIEALCNPELRLKYGLEKLVSKTDIPRILDIGAGPVSKVGWRTEAGSVDLVPVDPLAKKYKSLLIQEQLRPPIWTIRGNGEKLVTDHEAESFDLIHARNCIDHCLNPMDVIRQAIKVLKPDCSLYMNHYRNEGKKASYYGLHQWNFDKVNGKFVITDYYGETVDVGAAISDVAEVASLSLAAGRVCLLYTSPSPRDRG